MMYTVQGQATEYTKTLNAASGNFAPSDSRQLYHTGIFCIENNHIKQ